MCVWLSELWGNIFRSLRGAPPLLCHNMLLKENWRCVSSKEVEQRQWNNWNFSHSSLPKTCNTLSRRSESCPEGISCTRMHSTVSWFVQTVQGVTVLCYEALRWWPLAACFPVSTLQSSFVALKCHFEPLLRAFTQTTMVAGNQLCANRSITGTQKTAILHNSDCTALTAYI